MPIHTIEYTFEVTVPLDAPLPNVLANKGITESVWRQVLMDMDEGHRKIIPPVLIDVVVAIVAFSTLILIPCWILRFRRQHRAIFELTDRITKEHLEPHGVAVRYYPAGQYHRASLMFYEVPSDEEIDMEYKCDCCGCCKI